MVVKEESGVLYLPEFIFRNSFYRKIPNVKTFRYTHTFWYEGFKFAIGKVEGSSAETIVEFETLTYAVRSDEVGAKCKRKDLLDMFLLKCCKANCCMGEVISKCKSKNLDLELWQINQIM